MSRKLLLGAVSAFVLACGGAPPPEPRRAEAEPVVAPPPALPAVREASPELRRYWVFGKAPELAVYGDLEGLLHSELFEALMPLALNASGELLRTKQQGCLQALLSSTRALAVGANERGSVALLELGNEGVRAARTACVGSAFPVDRVKVAGADEAYAADENVVVVEPGVVLIGPKALVEAALASTQGEPWPSGLALEAEQQLKFVVDVKREVRVSASGVLSVGHEQLSATADVELPSEEIAQDIEKKIAGFTQASTTLAPPENLASLKRLAEAGSLERDGKHLKLAFRLHGPVKEQVAAIGASSALAIFGVRKYMAKAKAAEARIAIAQIAKGYVAYFASSEPGAKAQPKKLFSLPAVPPTIPRGTKYQSSTDDWKAWQPLGFSLADPQYYQYEVVAAKDGKSATIFARGDLNGDGKPSELRLKLRLDPKTRALSVDPDLEEANPED